MTQPFSVHGIDRELWMVLDLASDTELEGVHDMLFGEPNQCIPSMLHEASCKVTAVVTGYAEPPGCV